MRALRRLVSNPTTAAGLALLLLILAITILAPLISPYDPRAQSPLNRLAPPSADHLLGTDTFGRDVLSRVIHGSRVSLTIGVFAVLVGLLLGVPLGIVSAYFGGRLDDIIMRLVDALMAFPLLLIGMMIVAALGSNFLNVVIAIGIALVPRFARLVRGPTLSIKEKEFVEGARALGGRSWRIIARHVLPNAVSTVIVMGALYTATAIRIEASLSFLGLGVQPPAPTWGNMIRDGISWLGQAPWLTLASGTAIMLTVMAFNLVGDGLRDVLDPLATNER